MKKKYFQRASAELMVQTKDYGRPMKPFFIKIQNFWAWADKLCRLILRLWGYFRPNCQCPLWYQWVPCPCFPLFNNYFFKKLSLYIQIPNKYSKVASIDACYYLIRKSGFWVCLNMVQNKTSFDYWNQISIEISLTLM